MAVGVLHLDLEVVARLDVDHPAIADDLAGGQHLVGVYLQAAEEVRRQKSKILGLNWTTPLPSTGKRSAVISGLTQSYVPAAIMS